MPRSCTWMRNLEAPEVCGVRGCLPQEPLKVEVGLRKIKGAWDTGNTSPRSQQARGLCSLGISVEISTTARTVVS